MEDGMTPGKRLFDILAALILCAVLAVPFLILCIVLLITQGRPVFYVAERMKAPRHPFALWKLRTMKPAGAGEAGVSGGNKADRISPIGRFLRKTRADEIPQLWNVLRGDMSFVGPRPPLREYVERFPDIYAQVLQSRPGITGLASLHIHRFEERILAPCATAEETDAVYCRRSIPRKAKLDLIYQRHQTVCLDMSLLAQTAKRVLKRR